MRIRRNRIKIASWLIIPILAVAVIVEHNLHEARINANRAQLIQKGVQNKKQAVENLVQGCAVRKKMKWLPAYFSERLFGNCRSLFQVQLDGAKLRYSHLRDAHLRNARLRDASLFHADLRDADLRDADLSDAILSDADLHDANLFYADLQEADLFQADLSNADLSYAVLTSANLRDADLSDATLHQAYLHNVDLSDAYLRNTDLSDAVLNNTYLFNADLSAVVFSNAILLNTDFRAARELIQSQFEGGAPPLICNSPLPDGIKINPNRDCDQLASALIERYPGRFASMGQAEDFVNQQRQKRWQ